MTTINVSDLTPRAYEFACHSKACAPPPAGHGGSDKGGKAGKFKSGSGGDSRYGQRSTETHAQFTKRMFSKGHKTTHMSPEMQKHAPVNLTITKQAGQKTKFGGGHPDRKKYGTPKVFRAKSSEVIGKVPKSDSIAKFMGKMRKKSHEDYWGPDGPPIGKPLFGK